MWSLQYIFSQCLVIAAMACLAVTFLIKNKISILILCAISSTLYAIQYGLLGAFTGMILNLIAVARAIWFFINEKRGKSQDLFSLITIFSVIVVFSILTYFCWVDILAMTATLLYSFAIWQKKTMQYRFLAIVCSVCWITYNIIYLSIFGIVAESSMLIVEVIGVVALYTSNKKEKRQIIAEANVNSK